ncbi:hypothetical protein HT031_006646 [Scenedesmus sp. PABB004]|nr:hypothetical protein HT031_006646 [Scenedesmus sp. PABB004]
MSAALQAHRRACACQTTTRAFGPGAARPCSRPAQRQQRQRVVARAADEDSELEARLAALRKGKGATPDGEGAKAKASKAKGADAGSAAPAKKRAYDFSDETVHWEGGPAAGDLAFNVALGATLVALPLTVGAVARAAFVKYRFTDKRVSVVTSAPWENKQTDCAYQEVANVLTVSRGLGAWGDMVIELANGDKLELRSLEKFKELKEYVLARRDALGGGPRGGKGSGGAAALMDLDLDDAEALKRGSGKGFA